MGRYLSVANLRAYLDLSGVEDDLLLEDAIGAAEAYIDHETHRVFSIADESWRSFDALEDVDGQILYLDYDLVKDTEIVNGDGSVIPAASRHLLSANHPPYWGIRLAPAYAWTYSSDPADAIRVRGWWGYSITAPQDIVQATRRLAAYLYKQKDAQAFDVASFYEGGILTIPEGVPAGVTAVIHHYRRVAVV